MHEILKKALIVGARSQDGILLANQLSELGFSVIGVQKPDSISELADWPGKLIKVDFVNAQTAYQTLETIKPHLIFHLATLHASSKNIKEFEARYSERIIDTNLGITNNILKWQAKTKSASRSFIALSSKMYDSVDLDKEITLQSPYNPSGLYGETKMKCHESLVRFRENYNVDVVGLVLFNHTSKFSKSEFLVPTLANSIREMVKKKSKDLTIEKSNYLIDISEASDFVNGFIKIISTIKPEDYIFSSGRTKSIRNIVQEALEILDPQLLKRIDFNDSYPRNFSIYGDISKTKINLSWNESLNISKSFIEMITRND